MMCPQEVEYTTVPVPITDDEEKKKPIIDEEEKMPSE